MLHRATGACGGAFVGPQQAASGPHLRARALLQRRSEPKRDLMLLLGPGGDFQAHRPIDRAALSAAARWGGLQARHGARFVNRGCPAVLWWRAHAPERAVMWCDTPPQRESVSHKRLLHAHPPRRPGPTSEVCMPPHGPFREMGSLGNSWSCRAPAAAGRAVERRAVWSSGADMGLIVRRSSVLFSAAMGLFKWPDARLWAETG